MTKLTRVCAGIVLAVVAAGCEVDASGPIWVDGVTLDPDSLFLVPGESATFTSVPIDQRQNPLPERAERTSWSVANASIATVEANAGTATVTALQPGATFVRVALGRGTGQGPIYVEPEDLAQIRIIPERIELPLGSTIIAEALLVGLDGLPVAADGFRQSWRISNTQIFFSVGNQQVITSKQMRVVARNRGQAVLTLQVGDRKVTAPVIVF